MKLNHFTTIIRAIPQLTSNQISIIQHRINDEIQRGGTNVLIDQCKGNAIECPHCGAENVGKWGSASGLQRYKCKETGCRKTFNALTKTPLARLRKRNLWQSNLDCMFDGLPLWKVADYVGVAVSTAFRWRHRFLAAPTNDKPTEVAGIIEADEMIFLESYKGNQTIHHRKPRKRGGLGNRKLKDDKIPVLIVKDRNGGLTDCVLESHTNKEIHSILAPIVNLESVLCTDGASAYKTFAKEHDIKHYRNITSQGTRVIKRTYHIQNVNNYMSRLRTWMARFHGVGTAYLANYLGWMRMMENQKEAKRLELKMLFNSNFRNIKLS
jgi:transposase-like protein/IS1 family transposase